MSEYSTIKVNFTKNVKPVSFVVRGEAIENLIHINDFFYINFIGNNTFHDTNSQNNLVEGYAFINKKHISLIEMQSERDPTLYVSPGIHIYTENDMKSFSPAMDYDMYQELTSKIMDSITSPDDLFKLYSSGLKEGCILLWDNIFALTVAIQVDKLN